MRNTFLLQHKFLLKNSTKPNFIICHYLGFLRKSNGAWWICVMNACLVRHLFLQLLLQLVQNTHFEYMGMGVNKDSKPATTLLQTSFIPNSLTIFIPQGIPMTSRSQWHWDTQTLVDRPVHLGWISAQGRKENAFDLVFSHSV